MSLFVPERLMERLPNFGLEGVAWLERLPDRVAELAREWSLTVHRALDTDAYCSWIAPVQLEDGSDAILKIGIPHDEARHESAALRIYDGRGAVRLLRVSEDGFSLLLERCVPGVDLWSLGEEEGDAAGAAVLRWLWREPPAGTPIRSLSDLVEAWCDDIPRTAPAEGYDPALVTRALDLGRELAASPPARKVLHGDFHPSNVLSAAREPWLAIDPKPVVGDPHYDPAQWLANRMDAAEKAPDPVSALRRQRDRFSDHLGLDRDRVAAWAFVKSIGWSWGPAAARLLREAAGL